MLTATALAIAGAALLLLAIMLFFARSRVLRGGAPKSVLLVSGRVPPEMTDGGGAAGGMVNLSGKVVGADLLRAPVSGRPCSLWEVSLVAITPPSYADDSEGGYHTIWVTARSGDLVLEYEQRREITIDPDTGRATQRIGAGGRMEIPAGKVSFDPPGPRTDTPSPGLSWFRGGGYRPADPAVLAGIGLPADLVAEVRRRPAEFVVSEGSVAHGESLRLSQGPGSDSFFVYPLGREHLGSLGVGCLRGFVTAIATIAAVTGTVMLLAGGTQLLGGR